MDLSQVKDPDQYTLEDYAQANGLTPVYDDAGQLRSFRDSEGNNVPIGEDFNLQDWAYKQYQNQLNSLGLVQLTEPGMQDGTILNGITDSVLQQSPTAQQAGLSTTGDYVNYLYGPGTSGTGILGEQLYQGTTTTQMNPFDLGLGASDPIGNIILASILGAAGGPLSGALGGGLLGGVGAGALIGGTGSALNGGDFFQGALSGGITGGLGAGLPSLGITDPILSGAIKGTTSSLINGADPLTGAITGAAGAYGSSLLPTINVDSPTYTLSDGTQPSSLDVSVNSGNASLDRILASNSNTYAGADSITGGGPISTGSASYLQGLNDPFSAFTPILNQPQKQQQAAGGSNVSFFDDILDQPYDPNVDNMDYSQAPLQDWAMQNGVMNPDGTVDWAKFDQLDPYGLGAYSGDYGAIPDGESAAGSGVSIPGLGGILKWLLGNKGDSTSGLLGNGGVLGSGLSLGNVAAIAPSLAAINYARNQSPFDTSALQSLSSQIPTSFNFDTSKLTDAYNQFDPNAVTGQYDLNTAAGRGSLASSLAARGVVGSSFGNADLTNYGMQRDVGRRQLVNDAVTRRAGIANDILANDRASASLGLQGQGLQRNIYGDILNAQIASQKNKNDLYGRALLALSGGLMPKSTSLLGG